MIQGVVDIFDIEKVSLKQARRAGREGGQPDLMQDRIDTIMKPASYIARDTLIRDALHWIVHLDHRYLPVVDEGNRLIGVVTRAVLVEDLYTNVWGAEDSVPEDTLQTTEEPREGGAADA